MITISSSPLYGLILAGGKASRMQGNDKGLLKACGKMLVEYTIDALDPQTDQLMISANRHLDEYRTLGYPVISDSFGEYAGPLAGILSALEHIHEEALLVVAPCDMPELPTDLVQRLVAQLNNESAELCCVKTEDRLQPLVAVMQTSVHEHLKTYLQSDRHKVHDWLNSLKYTTVDYSDQETAFVNINTQEELSQFEQRIAI